MERSRLKHEAEIKYIQSLMSGLDAQAISRSEQDSKYQDQVTHWLESDSTTNQMIMLNTYTALKDWTPAQLMQASAEDKNVSKMVLTTPVGKYGFKLTDDQRQHFFDDAVKHTLGENLDNYQSNRKILEAVNIANDNLLSHHNQVSYALKVINDKRVDGVPVVS